MGSALSLCAGKIERNRPNENSSAAVLQGRGLENISSTGKRKVRVDNKKICGVVVLRGYPVSDIAAFLA